MPFSMTLPRGDRSAARGESPPQRQEIALVAAGSVQKQDRRARRIGSRFEFVHEGQGVGQWRLLAWAEALVDFGRAASTLSRRDFRNDGSVSAVPRLSTGSSTAEPGDSIVISKRTCPARGNRPSEKASGLFAPSCAGHGFH